MIVWMSKSEYAKETNKSNVEVQRLIDEGLLEAQLTEGGGKWMIKVDKNDDIAELIKIVSALNERVDKLANHLGVKTDNSIRAS